MLAEPSYPPLHYGIFSKVYLIDGKIIRKFPVESTYPEDPTIAVRNEKVAFKRIGSHPRIARWIPHDGCDYIDLEYYPNGNILDYLDQHGNQISPALVAQWGLQIIEAVIVIHASDIIHSDLNLKQIMLDGNFDARLSDFNASACLGQPALGYEKATHFLPRDPNDANTVRSDLFALGSTLYELAYCKAPYSELYPQQPTSLDPDTYNSYCKLQEQADQKVQQLFSEKRFPDISCSFCGVTIRGCWEERFASAEEVLSSYKGEIIKSVMAESE
jgi:serine/threonine protein kinase